MINTFIRNWSYFLPIKKRIGYIGWLGFRNLGDEVLYFTNKRLFSSFNLTPFKYTEKIKMFEGFNKKKFFDAVQLGGGTLINSFHFLQDFKLAQRSGFPTFVFGTGVRNPSFWQGKKADYLDEWVECLKKATYLGVRGPLSQKLLVEKGLSEVEIVGDPVLSLGRNKIIRKKHRKKLGINFGVSDGCCWGNEEAIFNFIVKITHIMQKMGWEITYLPVWEKDVSFVRDAARKNRSVKILSGYMSLKKTLDFLKDCDVFIGQKLHSVILAMCACTPSIMLEYRPKCLDFMMSMGMENLNMRTDSLSIDWLVHSVDRVYADSARCQDNIFEKVNFYKTLQRKKAEQLSKLISYKENYA